MTHAVALLILLAVATGLYCAELAGEQRGAAAYDLAAKTKTDVRGAPRRPRPIPSTAAPVWLGAAASQSGVLSGR